MVEGRTKTLYHYTSIERWRLIAAAGGGASTWRVTERPIYASRWREVIDRHGGAVLWVANAFGATAAGHR